MWVFVAAEVFHQLAPSTKVQNEKTNVLKWAESSSGHFLISNYFYIYDCWLEKSHTKFLIREGRL